MIAYYTPRTDAESMLGECWGDKVELVPAALARELEIELLTCRAAKTPQSAVSAISVPVNVIDIAQGIVEGDDNPTAARLVAEALIRATKQTSSIERTDELLPCPCCGSKAEFKVVPYTDDVSENEGGHYVECTNSQCGVTTRLVFPLKDDVQHELTEVWNRRVVVSATKATMCDCGKVSAEACARGYAARHSNCHYDSYNR